MTNRAKTAAAAAVALFCISTGVYGAETAVPKAVAPQPAVPPSFFEFSADAVYASRSGNRNNVLLEDTITGDPLLVTRDLQFGREAGLDARVRAGQGPVAFEARYFGGFDFVSDQRLDTSPIWNFPTEPPLFGLGVARIHAIYSSRFDAAEANIQWHSHPNLSLFLGVRVARLAERLELAADFGGNAAVVGIDADFLGVGPQVGAVLRLFGPQTANPSPFVLELEGRFAWLFSETDTNFLVTQAIGPAFAAQGGNRYSTYLAEGGVKVGFMFGPNAEAHVGYRVAYLGNVPTATAQMGAVQVIDGTILKSTEDYWIHGVSGGVLIRY